MFKKRKPKVAAQITLYTNNDFYVMGEASDVLPLLSAAILGIAEQMEVSIEDLGTSLTKLALKMEEDEFLADFKMKDMTIEDL